LSKVQLQVHGEPQVPCYFIFGDSLADNGNNNLENTKAKANYYPYGVDYIKGATGRFTNGKTMVDFIAEFLGFESPIPPYVTAKGQDILKGVNYASGSAGIFGDTGVHMGRPISLDRQLRHHRMTVSSIGEILKSNATAATYLNKCLYSVGMGSNDYINNYFLPDFYMSNRLYNPKQYSALLVDYYSRQIRSLYDSGARKIVLFGLGLMGCTPNAMAMRGPNEFPCEDELNNSARRFNMRLQSLVNAMNGHLPGAKLVYVNTYGMSSMNVSSFGFRVFNASCCQVNEIGQCIPGRTPCPNRNEYFFWDSYHPTEAVNKIVAQRSFNAIHPTDASPVDISHLARS